MLKWYTLLQIIWAKDCNGHLPAKYNYSTCHKNTHITSVCCWFYTHTVHINYLEPTKPHFKAMPLVPKKHIQTRLGAAVPGKLFTSDPLCQKWSFGTNCIWKCLYHDCDIEFGIILYRHLYTKDISRFANRMHCTAATIFYNLGVWLDFSWHPSTAELNTCCCISILASTAISSASCNQQTKQWKYQRYS